MKTNRPIFIAIEGIDGTGKSTLVSGLTKALGYRLLQGPPKELSKVREVFDDNDIAHKLFYAATNAIISEQVAEFLSNGESVICDRYWLSTKVYSSVREKDIDLDHIESKLTNPDVTIYLHIDEAIRCERMVDRGAMNSIDRRSISDVSKLHSAYDVELEKEFSGHVMRADTGITLPDELVNSICEKLSTIKGCNH